MDEFLYCPYTHATYKAQKSAIDISIKYFTNLDYDQIGFRQYDIFNRTDDTIKCLNDQIHQNLSIFNCYSMMKQPLQYIGMGNPKSFQIGHKCPHTDVHASCHWSAYGPTIYNDCNCRHYTMFFDPLVYSNMQEKKRNKTSFYSTNMCGIAHFSTNTNLQRGWKFWFDHPHSFQTTTPEQRIADFNRIRSEVSELFNLTRSASFRIPSLHQL